MTELEAIELKAHVPSKDFDVSKQFYQDIGFTLCWSNAGLALLHYGPHDVHGLPAILLQNYYVKDLAENLQMHLLVKDVDAWKTELILRQLKFDVIWKANSPAFLLPQNLILERTFHPSWRQSA